MGAWTSIETGRYRPDPEDSEAFQHWLVAVARNVARNLVASARMRHEVLMHDTSDTSEVEAPDPLLVTLTRAEARFADRLPDDQRALLVKLAMGATIAELAREARVPKSTMVNRVHAVRETIAAMIKRANVRGR
jgi:DNA-directed RNA polymerase specialized sigma24 family protein